MKLTPELLLLCCTVHKDIEKAKKFYAHCSMSQSFLLVSERLCRAANRSAGRIGEAKMFRR